MSLIDSLDYIHIKLLWELGVTSGYGSLIAWLWVNPPLDYDLGASMCVCMFPLMIILSSPPKKNTNFFLCVLMSFCEREEVRQCYWLSHEGAQSNWGHLPKGLRKGVGLLNPKGTTLVPLKREWSIPYSSLMLMGSRGVLSQYHLSHLVGCHHWGWGWVVSPS